MQVVVLSSQQEITYLGNNRELGESHILVILAITTQRSLLYTVEITDGQW